MKKRHKKKKQKTSVFIPPARRVYGEISPPGDKSISHRIAIIGSIIQGRIHIQNLCHCADVYSTLECLYALGVQFEKQGDDIIEYGVGLDGLECAQEMLNAGNSGTTMRLLAGLLAGQPFTVCIKGDKSLCRRPMRRIILPLSNMGAQIEARKGGYPPLIIRGGMLQPINYVLPVPSAQVKSAVLLAGIFAPGITEVIEPLPSRNHTELMLQSFGYPIAVSGSRIRIQGKFAMRGDFTYRVPGDFSSAAYFITAGLLLPDSEVVIHNVCLNPTRTGYLEVVQSMGGDVEVFNIREEFGEQVGSIRVRASELKPVKIRRSMIGRMIDELPLLAVLGTRAQGTMMLRHARELRVKESDRIRGIVENFRKIGIVIEERSDGFIVEGPQTIKGGEVDPMNDHRLAMTFAIAGLLSEDGVTIHSADCVQISYPDFFKHLESLIEDQ